MLRLGEDNPKRQLLYLRRGMIRGRLRPACSGFRALYLVVEILSKQLPRSGTSIGANIAEAQQAQSRPDFAAELSIALKETSETTYWLRLLKATDHLNDTEYVSINSDCVELEKIPVSILKTVKNS